MFALLVVLVLKIVSLNGHPSADIDSRPVIDLSYLGEKIFGRPSTESGKKLENWNEKSFENPEELGEYAEGDILFPPNGRNGLIGEAFHWKDGIVPYEISSYFPSNDRAVILKAMDIYHKYTCIKFRKRTSADSDYISIVSDNTGCWSSVGRTTGRQVVNLQTPYCTTKVGTPLHELMHVIGFLHEQNRFERDDFVSIIWGNIKNGHQDNFNKAEERQTSGFGVTYDYNSVMHYSKNAFSNNGQATIIPKNEQAATKMGQREGFSNGDLEKIKKMYNCTKIGSPLQFNKEQSNSNGISGLLSLLFS